MRAIDGKQKEFFENGASAIPAKERPVRQIDDPENLTRKICLTAPKPRC
jgi:hypothetical protein